MKLSVKKKTASSPRGPITYRDLVERTAKGRTAGCLSQTANENRFARFLNNRNITLVPADIRKEGEN
jgi:hypothetical protein